MKILLTGCAGFIGYHLITELVKNKSNDIVGIDNINDYYDIKLKKTRLQRLIPNENFTFIKVNINNYTKIDKIFKKYQFDYVINLAAQAGVRTSINKPEIYFESNLLGFFNMIDISRKYKIKHFMYASSSSVYGDNSNYPLKENYNTDHPLSFYAASKKCNEIMSYSYSNIYKIPCTGFRFFTVYGELGRPDMALYKFTKNIINSKKIQLYNKGNHYRDFTHISDVVNSINKLIKKIPKSKVPNEIVNIASSNPISLKNYVKIIEKKIGKKSKVQLMPFQQGDVLKTYGDTKKLKKLVNYKAKKNINEGIEEFISWFRQYEK